MSFLKKTKLLIFILFIAFESKAEIIENKKVTNQNFGICRVSCEEDVMFNKKKCKLFAEVTNSTTLFIQPQNLHKNQIVIVSNDSYFDTKMLIKIDNNHPIESNLIEKNTYKIIDFSEQNKKKIFEQITNGKYLFIRFKIINRTLNQPKEITVRLDLSDLDKAIAYFKSKITNNLSTN